MAAFLPLKNEKFAVTSYKIISRSFTKILKTNKALHNLFDITCLKIAPQHLPQLKNKLHKITQ